MDEYTILTLVRHTGGSNQSVVASIGTDWIFGLGNGKSAYWKMGSILFSSSPPADNDWHLLTGSVNQMVRLSFGGMHLSCMKVCTQH